jgi:hypothetical protein
VEPLFGLLESFQKNKVQVALQTMLTSYFQVQRAGVITVDEKKRLVKVVSGTLLCFKDEGVHLPFLNNQNRQFDQTETFY